uniref:F-box domain-containing protein n=1 Tax=Kwoniella pini CBS 10737 TaxID=1296096 RepID=A0A1B9I805_9TREE|nr:uncharacterized protein I206_02427 [Kwoniella pini CBS 10737]OCF51712.1 hypothetical protein I206_02427 [Kwoniella pini CBS 10737]
MPPKRLTPTKRPYQSSDESSLRKKTKTSIKVQRSIWNSKRDLDQLVSDSNLSTSSISIRNPKLRELPTLVKFTINSISRGFKRLWEIDEGYSFKIAWNYLPLHLKIEIRQMIFKWWGSFLTLKILSEVFLIPPHLYLPGELLSSVSSADHIKQFIPPSDTRSAYTVLTLKHASKASDIGIAGIIHHLPNLESINLKGCNLCSSRTVKTILNKCENLRKINLKGTKIIEKDIKALLDKFGNQLEVFKIDNVSFDNINETFSSLPFSKITHLCLPGTILNLSNQNSKYSSSLSSSTLIGYYPQPKPNNLENIIKWSNFNEIFPNLIQLNLKGLLIPENTIINLNKGLRKLILGSNGPPIPIETLIKILKNQKDTINYLSIGNIKSKITNSGSSNENDFLRLGEILKECKNLEIFKFITDQNGSKDSICDSGLNKYSNLIYSFGLKDNWRKTLKTLSLCLPQTIESSIFFPSFNIDEMTEENISPLEQLELPSTNIDNTKDFAVALRGFPKLRSLDLSGTTITGMAFSLNFEYEIYF